MLSKDLERKAASIQLIDVVPDKSIMQKVGKGGYSLSECLAELVDNSIDSFYKSYKATEPLKELRVKVDIVPHQGYVQVADDALGMDEEEARKCLRLGDSSKVDALGTYGIGLKGASMALAREVIVQTAQRGAPYAYRLKLEEQQWLSDPYWQLPLEHVPQDDRQQHGSVVRLNNLRRIPQPQEIERVREDFSKRYAAFLKLNVISIYVNDKKCQYRAPELLNDERFEFVIHLDHGVLKGWYGFLRRGSQIGQYGFDTFRYGRLITQYSKFGFVPHPTLARLVGEIHMDHVPPQTTKRGWQTESVEYIEAEEEIRKFLDKEGVIRKARALSAEAKVTRQVKEKVDQYLDSVAKAMNSPEVLALCPQDPASSGGTAGGKSRYPDGTPVGVLLEVEKRQRRGGHGTEITGDGSRKRTPRETHKVPRVVRVGGKGYRFEHDFADLGDEEYYKQWALREQDQVVQVYSNTAFPAYHTTHDLAYYAVSHVAESLSEFISGAEAKWEQVCRLKDAILRKAGSIQAQLSSS